MPLNIKPSTSVERKQLFIETLLNTTNKVSKVDVNSTLSGIASGLAKVTGKAEKDIILALSQLFPDNAVGQQLDQVALNFGIAPRFGALGSSTYIRLEGTTGTVYTQGVNIFSSSSGVQFTLDNATETIGVFGFIYAKVSSLTTGLASNVDPLSISQVSPTPSGHLYVVNEVAASGGVDIEPDEMFRIRIKDGANILARGTLSMLEQLFISINPKVLRCFYQGINQLGQVRIAVSTQNGQALSNPELSALLTQSNKYFSLTDNPNFGTSYYGVELINIEYQPIDISFRLDYDTSYNLDEIRKQAQIAMMKYLDFRFFNAYKQKVEWDNLIELVKNIPGVRYVPDQYFYPNSDVFVPVNKLPRLRGFLILDLTGSVLINQTGTLLPIYYPNEADFSLQQTVLNNI